jgi:uncharacterized membrane protein
MVLFANAIHLLALVLWVGSVVFFSLVAAPALFRTFPPEEAGRAVAAIFPTYYALGAVCGLVLLATSLWRARTPSRPADARRAVWVVGLMLAANLYAALVVQPRAADLKEQMRGEGAVALAARAEFRSTHGVAMGLNAAVLLGGMALVALTAPRLRQDD